MTHQIKHLRTYWKGRMVGHKFMAGSLPPRFSKMTQKDLIFGDFDKDKVANIDDPMPFNPKVWQQKTDVSLAKELKILEKETKSYGPDTRKVASILNNGLRNVEVKHRIKNSFSVINKMRRKFFSELADIGGVAIVVNDMKDVRKAAHFIEKRFKVSQKDDYYKEPKDGYYRAIHYTITYHKKPIEIQIKTRRDWAIARIAHKSYKQRMQGVTKKESRRIERLMKGGLDDYMSE
jgi:(p)ppGpp synthase/HD superfamily hydrolase